MKKLAFLCVWTAALALSACGGNKSDTLNESEAQNIEAETINDLAENAANAEMGALGNQAQQLEAESTANVADDTTNTDEGLKTDPSKVEDDVQGM